jgi:hypothetical protein
METVVETFVTNACFTVLDASTATASRDNFRVVLQERHVRRGATRSSG